MGGWEGGWAGEQINDENGATGKLPTKEREKHRIEQGITIMTNTPSPERGAGRVRGLRGETVGQ